MKVNKDNLKESVVGAGGVQDGKVTKNKGKTQRNGVKEEKAEIKEYMSKLQTIVPFMPKDKKLSKVEVISYAIDYIRELRITLGLSPCDDDEFDIADYPIEDESSPLRIQNQDSPSSTSPQRQPLCVISSPRNTQSPSGPCASQEGPANIPSKGIAV